MPEFKTWHSDIMEAVRDFHDRQPFPRQLGIVLDSIEPGRVAGKLAKRLEMTQQRGTLHAGVIIGLADHMASLAAYSLTEPGQDIVSANFSVQMLRPAASDVIYAEGWVVKPGKRFFFTCARVFGERDGHFVDFATAQITLAVL